MVSFDGGDMRDQQVEANIRCCNDRLLFRGLSEEFGHGGC